MKTIQSLNEFLNESNEIEMPVFEKRGKDLSPSDAAKEFNAKIKSLGIKADKVDAVDFDGTTSKASNTGDNHLKVDTIKIDPKTLGAMAPVFTEIELVINAVYSESKQAIVMILEYHWSHPSGSNGLRIRDSFYDGKWVGY
jgi:hypothetical protein